MAAAVAAAPLPPRLMNFFAKYPPKLYSAKYKGASLEATRYPSQFIRPTPSEGTNATNPQPPAPPVPVTIDSNPFLPYKVGRSWRGAKVSLRHQADLVKLAKKHGVEPLLPYGRKATAFKEQRLLEKGLRVKGTGEGQKVKGHKWERTMAATVEKRKKAMEEMPEMIRLWKQRGHGRGWKKYPR